MYISKLGSQLRHSGVLPVTKKSESKGSTSNDNESLQQSLSYVLSQFSLTKSELQIISREQPTKLQVKPSEKRLVQRRRKGSIAWEKTKPIEIPHLDKRTIDKKTHSPKHNVCVNLLKDGSPQAFIDIFDVFEDYYSLFRNVPVDERPKLEGDANKLEFLAKFLSKAEDSERKGLWFKVYQAKKNLAHYFHESGDDWLAQHFYHDCLTVAEKIDTDSGRWLAEANGFMGLFYKSRGNLEKALQHFQIMYDMTQNKNWLNVNYKSMQAEASFYVAKVYSVLADQKLDTGKLQEALTLYLNALEMTKKANDKFMMIKVYMKLGLMYKTINDLNASLMYFQLLEKVCKEIGEFHSLCSTYEEIANVYSSLDQQEQAKFYLKKFAYTAERHNLSEELIKASFLLGIVSVNQRNYDAAWLNYNKSFLVAQKLGYVNLGDKVRVHSGIAQAHNLWAYYSKVVKSDEKTIGQLLEWKLFPIAGKMKPPRPRRQSLYMAAHTIQ